MENERKKLFLAIKKALMIARVRESRMNLLCDGDWRRKLGMLTVKALRNKFKYIVGNCNLRTLRVLEKKHILAVDPEVEMFAKNCTRKRFGAIGEFSKGT